MITRRNEASALLGLRMLDHIIVRDERFHSFVDSGDLGDGRS